MIQAAAQTPDGALWLGTPKGLVRFDGQNFSEYSGQGSDVLRSHGVFCLLVTQGGELWIGTEGSGVLRISGRAVRHFGQDDGLTYPVIRTLYEEPGGSIWAGTDFGVFRYADGHFVRVDDPDRIRDFGVHSIVGGSGEVWAGGSRLVRYTAGDFREYRMPRQKGSLRIKSLCRGRDGTLWIGTVSGLYRVQEQGHITRVEGVDGVVRALRLDHQGRLWVGTVGRGLYLQQGKSFQQMLTTQVLPSNTVLSLAEDGNGDMFVGTQSGLLRLSQGPMQLAHLPDRADSDFGTLFRDHDGTIWMCSSHLLKASEGKLVPFTFPGLEDIAVRTMTRDAAGALWLGTMGEGAYRIRPDGRMQHFSGEIGNNYLRVLLPSRHGGVWIGTDGGISYWDGHSIRSFHKGPGALRTNVNALAEDQAGTVWIGTMHGLRAFANGKFVANTPTEELADRSVSALAEDANGVLWIGTEAGLYRWKSGKLFRIPEEATRGPIAVTTLVNNPDGTMWIGGPTEVLRLSRRELDAIADGQAATAKDVLVFHVSSETSGAELYGSMQGAGVADSSASAWFATTEGLLHIDLKNVQAPPAPPPIVIDHVLVDGREVNTSSTLELAPSTKTLKISYAPILLSSQAGLRFRPSLIGFDTQTGVATSERNSSYTNLPAGHYRFEVNAFYDNAPNVASHASLMIKQDAHFYATWYFAAIAGILSIALAWMVYSLRIHQLKLRFRAVVHERNRLAREIHDTVIQGCTGVSVLLEAYSSHRQISHQRRDELIDYARQQAKATVDEAREAIWNLRNSEPGYGAFSSHLRTALEASVHDFPISLEFDVLGEERAVDPIAGRELVMTTREAVRNAALHGSPQSITVSVEFQIHQLRITVSDDGCGFSADQVLHHSGERFGLRGMRERVEQRGGKFSLWSAENNGTHVSFSYPLDDAGDGDHRWQDVLKEWS